MQNILCQMFIVGLEDCLVCKKGLWDLELQHKVAIMWLHTTTQPMCARLVVRLCFMNLSSPRRPCRTPAAVGLLCRPAAPPAPASPQSLGR